MARAAAAGCGLAACLSSFATRDARPTSPRRRPGRPLATRSTSSATAGLTDELIAEALEAGFTAVVLTVDLAAVGVARPGAAHRTGRIPEDDVPTVVRARAQAGVDGG